MVCSFRRLLSQTDGLGDLTPIHGAEIHWLFARICRLVHEVPNGYVIICQYIKGFACKGLQGIGSSQETWGTMSLFVRVSGGCSRRRPIRWETLSLLANTCFY